MSDQTIRILCVPHCPTDRWNELLGMLGERQESDVIGSTTFQKKKKEKTFQNANPIAFFPLDIEQREHRTVFLTIVLCVCVHIYAHARVYI